MNLKGENVEKTSNYMALLICLVFASNRASLSVGYKIPVWILVGIFFLITFFLLLLKGKDKMWFFRESNSRLVTMECLLAIVWW